MFTALFLLAGWIACICFTREIIFAKGYDLKPWTIGAIFFSGIAFIAAVGMPISPQRQRQMMRSEITDEVPF